MSQVREIYRAIAAKSVTHAGRTPRAYDLDMLPNALTTAHLPARLLLPFVPRGEGRDGAFVAMGTMSKVTWRITDLALFRSAQGGLGLQDIAELLIGYAGAYAEMLRTIRAPVPQTHITGFRFVYGTFEWPESSGQVYDGVECQIDVEEILSGS